MLFYRTGYKIEECDAGTWSAVGHPDFVEFRFALSPSKPGGCGLPALVRNDGTELNCFPKPSLCSGIDFSVEEIDLVQCG